MIGYAVLFIASVDLYDLSSRQLHGVLDLYRTLIAEVVVALDELAVDPGLPDILYRNLVTTVSAITNPANAEIVRTTTSESETIARSPLAESAAIFMQDMSELARQHPELQTEYVDVILKAVRAARLWDLAYRSSRQPLFRIPAWTWNPWGERNTIETSRYDEGLARGVLSRLGMSKAFPEPLRHAY